MKDVSIINNGTPITMETGVKPKFKQNAIPVTATKNSSKDMLLYLTTLASTVVAGIALYKNHGAQKELQKVLEKLKTSEQNLKKAADETEAKIKNVVDEALKNTAEKAETTTKKTIRSTSEPAHYSYPENTGRRNRTRKSNNNGTREGLEYLADEEAAIRKAKKASDRRNQEWLEKQHKAKEKEYSEWFNKALDEKSASEGEAIIADEEAAIRKAKKASDRRNQEWLEKQHKAKEKEYSEWFNKALDEKSAREGEAIIADEEAAIRKAKKASDRRNQEWLEKEHKAKEKEYSEWFNKALDEKSAREGEAIIADEEAAIRKAKKASDRRNQEWLEKQHKAKEKEYNQFYNEEYKEAFDAIEEQVETDLKRKAANLQKRKDVEAAVAHEKSVREGLEYLADEEAAIRKAKKASDRRNQEWLEKEHKLKEQEYNELFEEHSFRANYLDKKATVRHFYNSKIATPVKEKFAQFKNLFSKKSA